jgi:hypothetical protein
MLLLLVSSSSAPFHEKDFANFRSRVCPPERGRLYGTVHRGHLRANLEAGRCADPYVTGGVW